MKRRTFLRLTAQSSLVATLTPFPAFAPIPIPVLCFYKVCGVVGLGVYAWHLYHCMDKWAMYKLSVPDELPSYFPSQKNLKTLKKTECDGECVEFCEGWTHDLDDLKFRCEVNSDPLNDPMNPVFPCGPGTGDNLPPPVRSVIYMSVQQSVNSGPFTTIATTTFEPGASFFIVPPSGMAGFSKPQQDEMRGSIIVTNPAPDARVATFRIEYSEDNGVGGSTPLPYARIQELFATAALAQVNRAYPGPIGSLIPLVPPFSDVSHIQVGVPGQPGVSVIVGPTGYGSILNGTKIICNFPSGRFDLQKLYDTFALGLTPTASGDVVSVKFYVWPGKPSRPVLYSTNLVEAKWLYATAKEACR